MISDEKLSDLSDGGYVGSILSQEIVAMAKELLAYRQAFSEHLAYVTSDGRMLVFADSPNMLPEDKSNLTPLYRKPTILS
ncbi:hypothetical protein [Pantoea stewartii]|uniref:hypothetical protein n=1 Tax=Pantoea stewartii TaxID=66269 RepID=UPI0025A03E93|nr:hypothetical protein [Pantoea stewartii]